MTSADRVVDVTGKACPMPLVALAKEVRTMQAGQTVKITGNDPILTGKIALAHLNEFPDYYTRLMEMERGAKEALSRTQ